MAKNKSKFPNLAAIAREFKFHRNTVGAWFKSPDAPKRGPDGFDFEAVVEWVKVCSQKEKSHAKTNPAMASAKLEEVLERVRKLRRLNDEAERRVIPLIELEQQVRSMASAVQNVLTQLPSRAALELAGQSPNVIDAKLKGFVHEILFALHHGGSPEAMAWSIDEVAGVNAEPAPKFGQWGGNYSARLNQILKEKEDRAAAEVATDSQTTTPQP